MTRNKFVMGFLALIGVKGSSAQVPGLTPHASSTGGVPTMLIPGDISTPPTLTGSLLGAAISAVASGVQVISLGPGLTISNGVLNVTVPAAVPPNVVYGEVHTVTANSQASFDFLTTPTGWVAVYRDGLRMTNIGDYTISGNTVTFNGGLVPAPIAGENVLFDYQT